MKPLSIRPFKGNREPWELPSNMNMIMRLPGTMAGTVTESMDTATRPQASARLSLSERPSTSVSLWQRCFTESQRVRWPYSRNLSLQAAPSGLDPERISEFLRKQRGVTEIHDLHVWPLSTTETALTVHLLVPAGYPGDQFSFDIAARLKELFDVDHATIQIETDPDITCHLESAQTVCVS